MCVDICGIDFCCPAMKSHQNVVHSPVKIDSAPELSEFAALSPFKRPRIFKIKTIL